jgi:hypothetical protein
LKLLYYDALIYNIILQILFSTSKINTSFFSTLRILLVKIYFEKVTVFLMIKKPLLYSRI